MKKEFEINSELYPEDIVVQAISDFSEVFKPHPNHLLKGEGTIKKFEIEWTNEEEINEIFNELMNYIIWLINE